MNARFQPKPLTAALQQGGSCRLPTEMGEFRLHGFKDPATGQEHAALTLGSVDDGRPVLARLHSECLTGDTLFSLKCDCGPQLERALEVIAAEGRGVLLYLRQEGRGIGLVDKIRAYALQDAGADTVDANRLLGLPDDARDYRIAAEMLGLLGIGDLRLLTNNPAKVEALRGLGVTVSERLALHAGKNVHNEGYLQTKALRMGHWFAPGADGALALPLPVLPIRGVWPDRIRFDGAGSTTRPSSSTGKP